MCPEGTYGVNCLKICLCGLRECDPETGTCLCGAGKMGPQCTQSMSYLFLYFIKHALFLNIYFINIMLVNVKICSCLLACPKGKYGKSCLKTCTCENGGTCNPKNGKCSCSTGFIGKSCEKSKKSAWLQI